MSFATELEQHGDEATADLAFSGFDDNVGLILSFFNEDFMGLEGALEQRSDQSGKRSVSRGTEFANFKFDAKATPIEPPQAEPVKDAPGSGDNGAHANEAPTPPPAPIEGNQAEASPGKDAAVR